MTISVVEESEAVADLDPRSLESLQALLSEWARLWSVPELAKSVGIRVSSRMRRSLGSYRASRQQITLAAWLFDPASLDGRAAELSFPPVP